MVGGGVSPNPNPPNMLELFLVSMVNFCEGSRLEKANLIKVSKNYTSKVCVEKAEPGTGIITISNKFLTINKISFAQI